MPTKLSCAILMVAGLASVGATGPAPAWQEAADADADRLFVAREDPASALAAAGIWERRLALNPDDYEAAWKLARASYWLGSHVPEAERRAQYERGIDAGRQGISTAPDRPEARFWMAAAMGAMAESFGVGAGIRYRGPIKRELETVLAIDPAYLQGAADRALGRWHLKVPWLFGGRRDKAVEHLQRSLTYDPTNAASHFFLAETFLEAGRDEDARRELQRVLESPEDEEWGPEVREFKRRARAMLEP